ncbi:MAG: DUF4838 domain-containing protein [Planctomycetaceae bacterium]|jgi:hypothetical protein|nr:DUF4838 domain-containing protein [Planctomycetaceae bacterium]
MTRSIWATFFIGSIFTLIFNVVSVVFAAETLTLSTDGKTNYVIVLPAEATPVEQTAAKELKQHLDTVTGADFVIVKESEVDTAKPQIVVGNSKRTKELLPEIDVAKIPYDGIIIKSIGQNLVLIGHPQRGTLYAVNTLLENVVGIRWWTSTETFIPKKPTLEIPAQNIEYAPKLIYREAFYRDAFDGVFATRMKCNGNMVRTTPEYGGHHRFQYFVHSFFPLIPPSKYFAEHPDWYSEIKGERKHEHAQLCLTNDAMCEELTQNAIESLRKNPDAKFISISQNDWHGYCECKNCTAIAEEEGGQAGALIRFVNKVAEAIEKEFPDVWVETLAYQYTRKPPKLVKPRKNVVIRLCTIECSFVQPLGAGEPNKPLREDIEGWSKIADHLFVWDYVTNFSAYMLPHPNLRVLAPNIRFFTDHHTLGLFEQGDAHCAAGDFVRLRNWVISHLLWNPALDEKKLFDEFLNGYYGNDVAPILKEYWNLLLDRAERSGIYLGIYRDSTKDWLDFETLNKAVALMNRAIETTKDETIQNRLRREKIPVDLVVLKEYHSLRRKAELTGTPFTGLSNPQDAIDDFFARCKEFGVTVYWEWDNAEGFKKFEQKLRQSFGVDALPPDFCKDLPKNNWYDIQSFELNTHKLGEWTFNVDDEKASNGRAVKMPGNHFEWATSYNFDDSLLDLKSSKTSTEEQPKYRLYAAVRCDAKTTEGTAMTLGVYDYKEKKGITSKSVPVSEISGAEYCWVDMGSIALKPGFNFWFAPPKRPDEVDAVYIDRIVVVRE